MKYIVQEKRRRRRERHDLRIERWENREREKAAEQMALDEAKYEQRLREEAETSTRETAMAQNGTDKEETKDQKETKESNKAVQQAAQAAVILGFIVPPMEADAAKIVDNKVVFSEEEQKVQKKLYAQLADFKAKGEVEKATVLTRELRERYAPLRKMYHEIALATKARRMEQYQENPLTEEDMARIYKPVDWNEEIEIVDDRVCVSQNEQEIRELISQRLFELKQDGKMEEHENLLKFARERNKPIREAQAKAREMRKDSVRAQLQTVAEHGGKEATAIRDAIGPNAIKPIQGLGGPS